MAKHPRYVVELPITREWRCFQDAMIAKARVRGSRYANEPKYAASLTFAMLQDTHTSFQKQVGTVAGLRIQRWPCSKCSAASLGLVLPIESEAPGHACEIPIARWQRIQDTHLSFQSRGAKYPRYACEIQSHGGKVSIRIRAPIARWRGFKDTMIAKQGCEASRYASELPNTRWRSSKTQC